MDKFSYISNAHPEYIEALYQEFKANPDALDPGWRKFFEGFEFAQQFGGNGAAASVSADELSLSERAKEVNVLNLINAYRTRGHLFTRTNPVRSRRKYSPNLDLANFGLSEDDLDTVFQAGSDIGLGPATLRNIVTALEETYCDSFGAEFMFIRTPSRLQWLRDRMERTRNQPNFSREQCLHILDSLNRAVQFENFLHTKYIGQKRFALSGGETVIPALDAIVERGATMGVKELVFGMAHRGRLNVLANIMRKSYQDILAEFEGTEYEDTIFEGDVKYHLGFSRDVTTVGGETIHLNLISNPSHLEAVNPVVEGVVRAKIDKRYGGDENKIIPILIHGDAALAGQGISYEMIQMSLLDGYRTGGTIHLVINNQLGFTTNYLDGRSSTYCTDVAKVTLSPVFHVNGDDVEAVVLAVLMAMEYRQRFHNDVFIDILGYRKYGHNESDEPRFTQPKLYKEIARHPDPFTIYARELTERGLVDQDFIEELKNKFNNELQDALDGARQMEKATPIVTLTNDWSHFRKPTDQDFDESPVTGIKKSELTRLAHAIFTIPEEKNVIDKVRRLYMDRLNRFDSGQRFDWAMGEALAYATLLDEGRSIRISGQDSERGTFSHRHSVLQIQDSPQYKEDEYIPLANIGAHQGLIQIYNSLLSEYAVLGFEFGYASADPQDLVIWEAQFGDFANGAQIIIDQFISASEAKWKRYSGMVLYLPHGYEGQGPEHSSARMERFLELCAQNNMQIVNCTTPANLYHVLRRQMKQEYRIPLIVFSPKSLLRHPRCISSASDFIGRTRFLEVIDDASADPDKVRRVLFCSGKIFYELLDYKEKNKRDDVAIVRLEQIYPLPLKQLEGILNRYDKAKEHFWVQEEPENMGPWAFLRRKFKLARTRLISREESASPATGFSKQHEREQQAILEWAFAASKRGPKGQVPIHRA